MVWLFCDTSLSLISFAIDKTLDNELHAAKSETEIEVVLIC